ncbi:hypothetical protein [Brachyspira hampsonii]|uniref:hypothetical protein n=1 Tax=Brachyspira hampsonii TaxID=1287055 RepID=UPI001CA53A34|nr:hypothetical protein [Brachyspira hampsonii]MBW5390278.1 hypothetical protein [Brachyspira hampsonii]
MPIPLIIGAIGAIGSAIGAATAGGAATAVIAAAATAAVAGIGIAAYKKATFKPANKDDYADFTILLLGEQAAGKDTVMKSLEDKGFPSGHTITVKHDTITSNVEGKIIKIINTSGSESTFANTEEARNLSHNIRCYVFDAREFYKDKKIKMGIIDSINECQQRGITLITIGTRGAEVSDINKIENEIRGLGVYCKIFEFKNNPREDLITYIFEECMK